MLGASIEGRTDATVYEHVITLSHENLMYAVHDKGTNSTKAIINQPTALPTPPLLCMQNWKYVFG